jgi:uncharacterized protein YjeT (DUF2065 family)
MLIIIAYAALLIAVSLWMIIRPAHWTRMAVRYCHWRYMHPTEIVLCLGFGAPFILFGEQALLPVLYKSIGYVLVIVGAGLMLVPPSLHQRLGAKVIEAIGPWFRPAGVLTLALGGLLLYSALLSIAPGRV